MLHATRRAAELGDQVVMNCMVRFLRDEVGGQVDKRAALVWAECAAKAGNLSALKKFMRIYLNGLICAAVNSARYIHRAERLREVR